MIRTFSAAAVLGASAVLGLPLPSLPGSDAIPWTMLRCCAALLLLMLPLQASRHSAGRTNVWARAMLLLAAAATGAVLAAAETGRRVQTRWPEHLAGSVMQVTGRIATPPRVLIGVGRGAGAIRFDLLVDALACPHDANDCVVPETAPRRVRVVDWSPASPSDGEIRYGAGERRRFTLKLDPPDGRLNRGGFDRERWLFLERIDASASLRDSEPDALAPARFGAAGAIGRLRQRLAAAQQDLPGANDQLALVQTLSLGLRGSLSPLWQERLQASGTAHLVAISGLHVGLVFGFVLATCAGLAHAGRLLRDRACSQSWIESRMESALQRGAAHRWLTRTATLVRPDLLALFAATSYAAMAGFALPAQRALLMLVVAVLVRRRARVAAPGSTLAMAALAVLLLDPVAPLSSGFWLSVGAVAALIWLRTGRREAAVGRAVRPGAALRLQLWLSLLLLPVTAWSFQQASLVSPLANLLAIPWVGFVTVPASLLATALAPVDALQPLACAFLWIAQTSLAGLARGLDLILRVPHAALQTALPDPAAMWLALIGLLVATLPNAGRQRGALLSLVPFLLLPALLHLTVGRRIAGVELHVLDVGHGLAAVVLTDRSTVLFDTGGGAAGATRLERDVLPYLRAIGRPTVDRLVLSHLDQDHAAGLVPLARRFPNLPILTSDVDGTLEQLGAAGVSARLYSGLTAGLMDERSAGPTPSPAGQSAGVRLTDCRAGEGFQLDGVRFDFLHPAAHDRGSDNDRSCVLLVSAGASRILLTGDIEAAAEGRLADRVGKLPVDVLVAPHHGSRSSSTAPFVSAFPTRHVVFAAERRSRWGFPHAEVRMRYKHKRTRMYVTGFTGSLVFGFDSVLHRPVGEAAGTLSVPASGREPSAWRDAVRRLWRPAPVTRQDPVAANRSGRS